MASKLGKCAAPLVSAVFTAVVAPVLVHALTHDAPTRPGRPATTTAKGTAAPAAPAEERLVVCGVGRTPEEAWYDALRKALHTTAAALVDARTWAADGQAIVAAVSGDGTLLKQYQELGCVAQGGLWYREVRVTVDRAAVTAKLRAARIRVLAETTP